MRALHTRVSRQLEVAVRASPSVAAQAALWGRVGLEGQRAVLSAIAALLKHTDRLDAAVALSGRLASGGRLDAGADAGVLRCWRQGLTLLPFLIEQRQRSAIYVCAKCALPAAAVSRAACPVLVAA